MHTIMITYNTLTHSALCAQHYMILEGFMQSETNQRLQYEINYISLLCYVLEVVVAFPLCVCLSICLSVSVCIIDMYVNVFIGIN